MKMPVTGLLGAGVAVVFMTGAPPACAAEPVTVAAAATYVLPARTPAYVRHAIAAPERSAEQRARDADRKPAELLILAGIKPGMQVLEFASFGQYFSALVADIIGNRGRLLMLDLPYAEARTGAASRAFAASHANTYYLQADYNRVELPARLDVVLNVLYYHDLPLNSIDTAALNARIFRALKPGGIYLIVDHNAEPGSGMRDTHKLHRIDPAVIRQEVLAAGFELVEESHLLASAQDDHTKLVFTPGLRGHTDQSVFKFRRPAR
jgi:predicted methyltransferase